MNEDNKKLGSDGKLGTGGVLNVGNALLKNEEEQKTVTTDPFSPTNTGLPVVIKGADGNRIGNVWSPNQAGLGDALRSIEKGESTKLYLDLKTGNFSNAPVSTMTYKDGKINLNVAKDVANSSWYKQVYEGQAFKDLAKAYALDPTGETKLEVTRGEEKEEKTINELLEGYAKDLEDNSKKYKSYVDTRTHVSRITGGALNLTDEDLDIMGSYQNFSKDSFSDTDAFLLPTSLQDYFKDYASYDADSGAISAKDFYEEFFNLNKEPTEGVKDIIETLGGGELAGSDAEVLQQVGESDKDYAINLVRVKTSQEMLDIVERATFYKEDLSEAEKANLATEYVKCFALNKAMTKDTPNTDSWTGFNLAVQGFGTALADSVITAGESLEHFWSQVVSEVMDGGVRTAAAISAPFSWFHELFDNLFTGGWDKMTQNTRAMYEHFDEWYTENTDERSMLGEMRESIDELGKAISNREDLAAQLFEGREYDLAQSYANTEAMLRIGHIGGLVVTQILATNPIGQTAGGLAELAFVKMASVGVTGYRFATLANMASTLSALATTANTALQAARYMRILNTIKLAGKVVGFTANMYVQGVVDTFIENPALTDALLHGETEENIAEFQNQLRMNIMWNTVGEFAPGFIKGVAGGTRKGASKATNWLAQNTRIGAFTQASLRKTVNFFTLRGRKAYEGIAEFMTDKFPFTKQGEYTIEGGGDVPFSGKLTPAKRMQSLRKDIIKIQEDIEKAKILGGDGVMDNAKAIDDLIQTRIDLEQVLGTTKKLAIAQAKQTIIKNAGLDIEVAEVSEYTAKLTQLSKKMKQTNLPGSFSKETGDYMNDLFNQRRLLNKQEFLEKNGKVLSKSEKEGLDLLSERISKYEASLPAEHAEAYKTAVRDYMEANYRFYYKLNNYLASDAGGNVIPREVLEDMRANSQFGEGGRMWMHQKAVDGFKSAQDLQNYMNDPLRVLRENGVSAQVEAFDRKTFSAEVTYFDPNYARDMYIQMYARIYNGANMADVAKRAGATTSVPTDSQGNILKTQKDVAKAKDALYKDLEKKFESSFRENLQSLGQRTIETTKGKAKDYYKTVKRRAQRTVNDILGLNSAGLKTYATTLNSAEIEQISKVYSLPAYSRTIKTTEDLTTMYDSLSEAQKKIVKKNVPAFKTLDSIDYTTLRNDYTVKTDSRTIKMRESLENLEKEYDSLVRDGNNYRDYSKWEQVKTPEGNKAAKQAYAKVKDRFLESRDIYAKNIGYTGTSKEFDTWFSARKESLEEQIRSLRSRIKKARGTQRPEVTFDGDIYTSSSNPVRYIKKQVARQNITDEIIGDKSVGDTLGNRWLTNAEPESKAEIREAIESNPDLRSANLSTMYDNSGSSLSFEEWLDTPITLRRQQVADSLRKEDAFLSFSMHKDWEGINGIVPRLETEPGDIISLKIKPRNTLGQITMADGEGELEILVPREAYATAMTIADESASALEDSLKGWNYAVTNNNLDMLLSRQYVMDDKTILRSTFYKNMVGEARAAELEADEALALRTAKAEVATAEEGIKAGKAVEPDLKKINAQKGRDFKKVVRGTITEAVDGTVASLADNPYLEQLIKEYEKLGISSDVAKEYIILQWLYDNSGKGGVLQDIAFRYYNAPSKVSEIKVSTDAAKGYSRKFRDAAESIIESKLNRTVKKINEQGVEGLVDLEATATRVDKYFKDITDLWGNKQIVEAWDRENGRFIYYQVDRDTYNLVTNYPTFKKANGFARAMARINSIARVGQITIRAASLVTQGFKDTFDAVVLGGWDELLLDNPDTYKKIAEYIGPETVEAFRKEMTPNAWKDFLAMAEWQGLSVEEAIAKSEVNDELLKMKIEGGSGTSAGYFSYRSLYEPTDQATLGAATQIEVAKDTWTGNTKAKWKEAYNKARVAWYNGAQNGKRGLGSRIYDATNALHNARETFLRQQVYRQNFMEALNAGKSLSQARNYAQYFMENATTKFSRGFAWGDNIIRSIPYFGAMLNGASSMVRLLEVDPLGIMTRFTTNLILPVVGLTAMSLQDPKDAEIYRNIPEYEKEGNLHWVVNGQVETIPLPEELAKFILPIRHAVENIAGANDNAWHELLLNDLLNMPVVPLNAVMMLDDKKINGDPSVMDRINALAMDVFNTLAPNAARTMYIARTGKDPYTGEDYGRMRWYQDENGEYQLMAESEYGFANDMANLFKSWGWENVSAVMAEALFSSFFGAGTLDVFEGIRDLAASAQQGSPDMTALISPSMERAGKVLTGTARTDEQQARIAWYSLYNEIKDKKNELLAPDGKLAKYSQDIDMAKDQDTLAKKTELYDSEVNNWQNYVLDKVKAYNSTYGNYFTRSKFASTISMMTANLSIDRVRNSDNYYNARALAIETMYDAGFTSPSDTSIFGYIQRDMNTGKVAIKYTDPLVVSLTENLFWYQGDEAVQMLEDTIELSGLKTKYNEVIYPEYNKYMSTGDYTSANKLAAKWDVELMKTIKPIIDEYTVGNLLSKSTAMDLLDNYILVPNTTDAIGKGKYYSSKTGLNKRRGFAGAYAKKIYNALNEENK